MPRPARASVETFEFKGAALPPAVAAFINAINSSNLEGLMEAFVPKMHWRTTSFANFGEALLSATGPLARLSAID
jgi:hypothetical protein